MKQNYDAFIFDEMRKIGASMHVLLNKNCEPYGITRVQMEVLLELCHKEKVSISELAHKLSLSTANLSAITKRMEKSGFVERKQDINDRRIIYLQMTEKAEKSLCEIDQDKVLFDQLSEADFKQIMTGLKVLSDYIEERRKQHE